MKAKRVLKRIAKIEALISKVTERSSGVAPNIRELLRDAKTAVIRAKEALRASFGKANHPPVKRSQPASKATPEPSRPKRKISAAGRKAISKKRLEAKRAAMGTAPTVAKKTTAKKVAVKKAVPRKAAKAPAENAARKVPAKKVAPVKAAPTKAAKASAQKLTKKAPAKKGAPKTSTKKVVRAAKTPVPPTMVTAVETPEEDMHEAAGQEVEAIVNTPEQSVPEVPVHEAGESKAPR